MEMKPHSAVNDLKSDYEKGKMSRREFIRFATLLGVSAAAATQMAGLAWPGRAQAAAIKRGGKLRVAAPVQKVTHPAQFSWIAPTNQLRQVTEYLTFTDGDNITHPYLVEKWETRYKVLKPVYRLRKEKAELVFAHLRKNLNFDSFLLRGLKGVRAELSLLASCFNLTRMINLVGVKPLITRMFS